MPESARLTASAARALEVAVIGTGTGVGKTMVSSALVRGLRQLQRAVWVHKPIACGGWDGHHAEDGRLLAELIGDGQPSESICPLQYPQPAAPSLAAWEAGETVTIAQLRAQLDRCRGDHDLVIEGAGGILSPLSSDRRGILEVLAGSGIPAVVVCTPGLGTLNATALTCREASREGLPLLGLVLNHQCPLHQPPSLAERHAEEELCALTGLEILCTIAHQDFSAQTARTLAERLLAAARRLQPAPVAQRGIRT